MQTNCDFCAYNEYDEEDECYYCSVNMDEDDMARFMQSSYKSCPYYKSGDEYQVVRHQMQHKHGVQKMAQENRKLFSYALIIISGLLLQPG